MTITTYLAIWGCVLSTILAIIEIRKHFKDKADVKVSVRGGWQFFPANSPLNLYGDEDLISISSVNKGRRPVFITKVGLLKPRCIKGGKHMVFTDSITTIELTEGKNKDYYTREGDVQEKGLTPDKYVAFAVDTTGKKHWSHNWFVRLYKLHRLK